MMSHFIFEPKDYLQRIRLTEEEIKPTYKYLKAIHRAQYLNIPFENFDICLGRTIRLEPQYMVEKLVHHKRGGYCFELNGLLLLALQSFGFEARPLLGRVHLTGQPTGRGHQICLVTIEQQKYLLDAGFGANTPLIPIPLVYDEIFSFESQKFRLVKDPYFTYLLQYESQKGWKNLYSFDLGYTCEGDIAYGNHFTSTHPSSLFTKARIAVTPIENGIITLLNRRIRKALNGKEEIIYLEENQSYISALKEYFGIELHVPYQELKSYGSV